MESCNYVAQNQSETYISQILVILNKASEPALSLSMYLLFLSDMMKRRKVDVLYVYETRWKSSKARSIAMMSIGRDGVGLIVNEEFVRLQLCPCKTRQTDI